MANTSPSVLVRLGYPIIIVGSNSTPLIGIKFPKTVLDIVSLQSINEDIQVTILFQICLIASHIGIGTNLFGNTKLFRVSMETLAQPCPGSL